MSDVRVRGLTGVSGCRFPRIVDDLYICAIYSGINGPGFVLGSAGPGCIRSSGNNTGLPVFGYMEFDVEDVPSLKVRGSLGTVILHEMAHILGQCSRWTIHIATVMYAARFKLIQLTKQILYPV